MEARLKNLLNSLEAHGSSAAAAVVEHLRTVASNGDDYATEDALRAQAESLIQTSLDFLAQTGGVASLASLMPGGLSDVSSG